MIKSAHFWPDFLSFTLGPRLYLNHAGCKWHIQAIYFQVVDLYEEQHHWAYLIGPLSGVATAVLIDFMQYPRKSHAVTVSRAK